jgi:hypothetical protein
MRLTCGFKLYNDTLTGDLHIANPARLIALCGANTYGMANVHPDDAKKVCTTCQSRQDNLPGAWELPNYAPRNSREVPSPMPAVSPTEGRERAERAEANAFTGSLEEELTNQDMLDAEEAL